MPRPVERHALAPRILRARVALPSGPPLWRSSGAAGQTSRYELYGAQDDLVLWSRRSPRGRIRIQPPALVLDEAEGHGSLDPVVEGMACALWMEARGVPALHANVVAWSAEPGSARWAAEEGATGGGADGLGPVGTPPGLAVGLLGLSGAGKSALSMLLLGRGARLVSDEVLPVWADPLGRHRTLPGRGKLRLLPDMGERLSASFHEWRPVVPGASKRARAVDPALCVRREEPWPVLGLLLVLDRAAPGQRVTGVHVQRLSEGEALRALLASSLVGEALLSLGWEADRLPVLAALVRSVSVARLTYPSGLEHAPAVAQAVIQALDRERTGGAGSVS